MSGAQQIVCTVLKDTEQLQTLARIFETTFAEGEQSSHVSAMVVTYPEDSHFCAIGAMCDDTLVGGLVAYELPLLKGTKEMYLYDIAVLPSHQQQGIGTLLIDALKDEARRRGVSTIFVEAEAEDVGAVAFYRSLLGEEITVHHFNIPVDY